MMKKDYPREVYKDSYLRHLKIPNSMASLNSKKNNTFDQTTRKKNRPAKLPPLLRSKSPERSYLKDSILQKKYEDLIKFFYSQRPQKKTKENPIL